MKMFLKIDKELEDDKQSGQKFYWKVAQRRTTFWWRSEGAEMKIEVTVGENKLWSQLGRHTNLYKSFNIIPGTTTSEKQPLASSGQSQLEANTGTLAHWHTGTSNFKN